ncbi:MAG: nucleoside triphosphate pyrophosphohydrolase [Gammaproteobacteria bacterium]|nr:nucleoside triphosphate pyrophosphohydrolase [Gammaproteobacteria bacterium]
MAKKFEIGALIELMARLRDPDGGCPWDLEQNFASVAPYTIEEAYEVADAIERGALGELKGELGDLLFQVVFHARMAEEEGLFCFDDVVEAVVTKMTRRHPHVFGDACVADVAEQSEAWERIKREEQATKILAKLQPSLLDGVTRALPAISRAEKLQRRAARGGFDWPDSEGVVAKIEEELAELQEAMVAGDNDLMTEELGDLLFSCTNLARHLNIDGEQALRRSNEKFEARFRAMELLVQSENRSLDDCSALEQDQLWQKVKREG